MSFLYEINFWSSRKIWDESIHVYTFNLVFAIDFIIPDYKALLSGIRGE